jgi:hypothetical protein
VAKLAARWRYAIKLNVLAHHRFHARAVAQPCSSPVVCNHRSLVTTPRRCCVSGRSKRQGSELGGADNLVYGVQRYPIEGGLDDRAATGAGGMPISSLGRGPIGKEYLISIVSSVSERPPGKTRERVAKALSPGPGSAPQGEPGPAASICPSFIQPFTRKFSSLCADLLQLQAGRLDGVRAHQLPRLSLEAGGASQSAGPELRSPTSRAVATSLGYGAGPCLRIQDTRDAIPGSLASS